VASNGGPAPTGTVIFNDGAVSLGTGALDNNGVATLSTSSLTPGQHPITATYLGDGNTAQSTSAVLTQTVLQIATTTAVVADANPANAGATLTFTATVLTAGGTIAGGNLTGLVKFLDGATTIGTGSLSTNGVASMSLATLSVGQHSITAVYVGNVNYSPSTSALVSEKVQQVATTTTLTSSVSPSIAGTPITLFAQVSGVGGVPAGNVTFKDGNFVLGLGTLDVNGRASLTTSSLSVGMHSLTTTYNGDANDVSSTSAPLAQVVNIAKTYLTLASSANPTKAGINQTFTSTLTSEGGQPTGSITFKDGGVILGTVAVNGVAPVTLNTASLSVGSHSITAVYSGDANNDSSTSPVIVEVVQQVTTTTTVTSSENPGQLNQPVTFTSTVSSVGLTPTGSITFQDGPTALGTVLLNASGSATLATSVLSLGSHSIIAVYSGDANHITSQSTVLTQQILQPLSISIGTSGSPSIASKNVSFMAKLTAVQNLIPVGSITFKDGASVLGTGTVDGTGTAVFNTSALAVGQHSVTAVYSGDSNYQPITSSALIQTVQIADSNIALTSSANPSVYGTSLSFTAVVTGTGGALTGTVTFQDGTTVLGRGTLSSAGAATYLTTTLTPGMHGISAVYGGDGNNLPITSAILQQQVQQVTKTTLASNANPSLALDAVVLTCTVSNGGSQPPTGVITFAEGALVLGSAPLDATGIATLTLPSLAAGQHSIFATYGGDIADLPSNSGVLAQTVERRATTDVLTATSTSLTDGQQLTLISVVRWTGPIAPTGAVSFKIGSTILGTSAVDKSGVATLTIKLDAGSASMVASYSGDASYSPSDSVPTTVSNGPATQFNLDLSQTTITLKSKQHVTLDVTLTSIQGFTDSISLGCLGLPFAATCTFSKVQPDLPANSAQTVHVVIDTGSPLTAGGQAMNHSAVPPIATLCFMPCGALLGLLLLRSRSRTRLTGLLLLLCFVGLTLGLSGCGGLQTNGTPPGSYAFKVTASAMKTGQTKSVDMSMTVQQ
jgi:hypothetical protein